MTPVSNLNILFTTAHFPFPLIGGDRIKQYHILKRLSRNNNIFVVSFDRWYPIKEEYILELGKLGVKSYGIELNIPKAYLMGARYSLWGGPLEIEFFRDKRFAKTVDDIFSKNKIDLAINFFLRTSEYVRNLKCKKILLAEDCRSYYQKKTYERTRNLKQKAIRYYESKKLEKYEAGITNYFDVTTLVTEEDKNEMQRLNPSAEVRILTNGVDTDKYKPVKDKIKRKDIIFLAKLDIWVNNLMLDRLVESILPKILDVLPSAKLHIVGANPQKKHYKLQSDNIILHSNVPDIVPFLQKSAVFIHPHIGGSGIQNKVLEAMSCGCPVITTKNGARGIKLENGLDSFILENNNEIAEQAIQLLRDEKLVEKIEKNSREFILKNHKWDYVYDTLDQILDELTN